MKKKGFTLIELLAVIVILAVIALIATPLIMNVINDARKSSFKDSAYGITKAVELRVAKETMGEHPSPRYKVDVTSKAIDYSGDRPTEGWAYVDENGKVELYMCNASYCASKAIDSNEVTITNDNNEMDTIKEEITRVSELEVAELTENGSEGGETTTKGYTYIPNTDSNETYLGILYLDPTDLSATCNAELAADNKQGIGYYDCTRNQTTGSYDCPNWEYTSTGTSTGCMKWFTFGDDGNGNPAKAILDHNTTARAAYDFQKKPTEEAGRVEDMYEITWYFSQNIRDWDNGLEARFPTATEIAEATGGTQASQTFFGGSDSTRGKYWWLYTNLVAVENNGGRGNDNHRYLTYEDINGTQNYGTAGGYWTSTPSSDTFWFVVNTGRMLSNRLTSSTNYGVRPVISLSSLDLSN